MISKSNLEEYVGLTIGIWEFENEKIYQGMLLISIIRWNH
jgi:hypothetical protein